MANIEDKRTFHLTIIGLSIANKGFLSVGFAQTGEARGRSSAREREASGARPGKPQRSQYRGGRPPDMTGNSDAARAPGNHVITFYS